MSSTDAPLISSRPRISIDGNLRANMGEAALAVLIHLPRSGMGHAELRLLNWGPDSGGQPDFLFQDLQLGNRIEITLGETAVTPAFSGEITAIEERYGDGAPQCVILAEDLLHRLARQRHNRVFEDMPLDDVIRQIASEANLQSDIHVASSSGTWLQVNESNLAFLQRQLAPHDVGLRLVNGQVRVRDEESDPAPITLDPGSAQNIRVVADLNHQPRTVNVQGYDLASASEASATADTLSPAASGQTAAARLAALGWDGDSILPQPFARSQAQAQAYAEKQFRQRARRFLYGEIICQGNSELRSGREVQLDAVSPRLAGRYRVLDCWHQFDSTQGLRTRIQVQRADWNPS